MSDVTAIVTCPSCSSHANHKTGLWSDAAGDWWVTWRCLSCDTQHHVPAENGVS